MPNTVIIINASLTHDQFNNKKQLVFHYILLNST